MKKIPVRVERVANPVGYQVKSIAISPLYQLLTKLLISWFVGSVVISTIGFLVAVMISFIYLLFELFDIVIPLL